MDAGDGVAQQIVRYHIDPCLIDMVVISHTHPDHAGGLLLLLQRMYISRRSKSLLIYVPGGLLPGFQSIFPYFNIFIERWPFSFELKPIVNGLFYQGHGIQIEAIKNGHVSHYAPYASQHGIRAESFSFVITEKASKKMIYTADIDDLEYLLPAAGDTRFLLSECTHVAPDDVICFAKDNDIKRIAFTHIPPELETSIHTIKSDNVNIRAVNDGDIIEV